MNYRYSICHIDKLEIEYKNDIINKDQVLKIVENYPWAREIERAKLIDESEVCYSPSLDFSNIDDNYSLCLTAEGEPSKVSFSLWYNRPVRKKVLFGLLGERDRLEVVDKHFEKEEAMELLTYFLNQAYDSIERRMTEFKK